MKRYKLLKDLPFAKVGDILSLERSQEYGYFKLCKDRSNPRSIELYEGIVEGFIDNFDEWFEEIKEPKIFFTIDIYKSKFKEINTDYYSGWSALEVKNIKDLGLLFKTKEEIDKFIAYLKAKAIIKQDTKGFKPNWNNEGEKKFFGSWNFQRKEVYWNYEYINKYVEIYFKTNEDIEESFEKHSEEWKTYLTYEQ
jgi:hypothetical protein|nr:MAG TPA: hypothetical protein [Caudoviricetes sp.]